MWICLMDFHIPRTKGNTSSSTDRQWSEQSTKDGRLHSTAEKSRFSYASDSRQRYISGSLNTCSALELSTRAAYVLHSFILQRWTIAYVHSVRNRRKQRSFRAGLVSPRPLKMQIDETFLNIPETFSPYLRLGQNSSSIQQNINNIQADNND